MLARILAGLFVAPSPRLSVLTSSRKAHQTGFIGDTLTYKVSARDVTSPGSPREIISAFDIDMVYDPGILRYAPSVVFGSDVEPG